MDYSGIKTIGDFGFNYTVRHLGILRGIDGHKKDAILITFIFDQMPVDIIKQVQKLFLYEYLGIDVKFRIPWNKAV